MLQITEFFIIKGNFMNRIYVLLTLITTICFAKGNGSLCPSDCQNTEECMHFNIYGEYLFWKINQDQLQYAAVLSGGNELFMDLEELPSSKLSGKATIKDQKFDCASGVRLGAQAIYYVTMTDLNFYWTHIDNRTNTKTSGKHHIILPITMPIAFFSAFINGEEQSASLASCAKSKWHFCFNTYDLEIGQRFVLNSIFGLRPFVGVKFASIQQKQSIQYKGFELDSQPVHFFLEKTNHFWGVGPSFGIQSALEFCSHWYLTGSLSLAWLYGKFDVKMKPQASIDNASLTIHYKNNRCRLRPNANARLGIDWETYECDRWKLYMGIAYEIQYWWNQWQVPPSAEAGLLNFSNSPQGDLSMQGLTVHASLLF